MGIIIHAAGVSFLSCNFFHWLATVRLTCCWWFFPWLYLFPLGSYCELVMSKKKPLLQLTVAVFFFAAVRSDGTNNTCCCVSFLTCNFFHRLATVRLTCCWWFFPWLYFFSFGSYCELVMSEKKPLLQLTVAVFFFAAVRSDETNNTCCYVSLLSCNFFHWLATVRLTCCW